MAVNNMEKEKIFVFKKAEFFNSVKLFFRFIKYARPYWILAVLSLIFMFVDISFSVGIAWVQEIFINTINEGQLQELMHYLRIGGIISAFAFIMMISGNIFRNLIAYYMERDIAYKMVRKIHTMSFEELQSMHSGDVVSRANNDVWQASSSIIHGGYNILSNLGICVLAFFYLSQIDLFLSLLALFSGPVVFIVGRFFDGRIRELSIRIQELQAELRGKFQEILQGMETIRSYNLQDSFYNDYSLTINKYTELLKNRSLYNAIMYQGIYFTNFTMQTICVYLISLAAIRGRISIGAVMAFFILINRVQWPFMNLSQTWGNVQQGFGATDRFFEFLSREEEEYVLENDSSKKLDCNDRYLANTDKSESEKIALEDNGSRTVLKFKDVNFSYKDEDKGLLLFDNISFELKEGDLLALVGPSGAGKSTLARMACGLYRPRGGQIELMGFSIFDNLNKARSLISYVPQSPYLFTGTIRENIAYGIEKASNEDIIRAAKAANAHDFILGLEKGYDSQVGEHGSSLSGGERQRISIARAFIRNSPILILDEATSSLDNESEKLVQESIERLMEGRTSLVIAHRLSTVRNANRIIVLDQGRIVEDGCHEKLLDLGGIYASFYNHQFSG